MKKLLVLLFVVLIVHVVAAQITRIVYGISLDGTKSDVKKILKSKDVTYFEGDNIINSAETHFSLKNLATIIDGDTIYELDPADEGDYMFAGIGWTYISIFLMKVIK